MYRGRAQPEHPFAPAHGPYNRLLHRLEPDPEELWAEAEPLVGRARGALVIDDSTLDKRRAKRIGLVARHWSGKHSKPVRGISLIALLRADGDREVPVDYRPFSKADGEAKRDHSREMPPMAAGRGPSPKYVLIDTWYASLGGLKQARGYGWHRLTRLRGDRVVSPDDRRRRRPDEVAACAAGTVPHPRGYGPVRVPRIAPPDGDTGRWATDDPGMGEGARRHYAEVSFAIEDGHRERRQYRGLGRCRARAPRARRGHIGLALRASLRLGWHFLTTGVSAFEAKSRPVRAAVRSDLARPFITLPKPSTA